MSKLKVNTDDHELLLYHNVIRIMFLKALTKTISPQKIINKLISFEIKYIAI